MQITMTPPKAGMKVSMLGSSYARTSSYKYATAPLSGAVDYSTGTTYGIGGAGLVKNLATDGSGNTITSGGDSVLDWVKAIGSIGTTALDSITGSANAKKAAELLKNNSQGQAEAQAATLDMNALTPWLVGGAVGIVALIILAKKL